MQVVEWVKTFGFKVLDVHFERTKDLGDVDVDVGVAFRNKRMLYEMEQRAQSETDFQLMALRQP